MIGPSAGATGSGVGGSGGGTDELTSATDDPCGPEDDFLQSSKRRAIEELDFDSICEEVCGHPHKRPRLLEADLLHADPVFFAQSLPGCDDTSFDVLAESCGHHHVGPDGTVTRLEVLVVDSTWNEALEGLEAAEATVALQPFGELTPVAQPVEILHGLPSFQESYWSHDPQPPQEQEQANQQEHLQQQTTTTMPKVHGSSSHETGRPAPRTLPSLSSPGYEDQENGNLSWLLDFKLDSFIEAHEDRSTVPLLGNKARLNGTGNRSSYDVSSRRSEYESSTSVRYDSGSGGGVGTATSSSCTFGVGDARNSSSRCGVPKKPPFTYTELIEHALQERGELTVSAIYQWISEHFPYYKSNDDRWKNSVRHNLSINPHFRKGSKAPHGAGHLWAIASQDEGKSRQFFNIATIRQALKNDEANNLPKSDSQIEIDEVAAATASIAQPVDQDDSLVDAITLEHCAEQILSGIKKEVEVQYLVPMLAPSNGDITNNRTCTQSGQTDPLCPTEDTDFLNPVSKEIVAEECGLLGEGYLVTDLNPSSLGLNMAESEVVTTDNLFGEELSFQFYEFASPSQLQSA